MSHDTMKLVGGRWVPAIPEPYPLLIRVQCACGAKFWKRTSYVLHYVNTHIQWSGASPTDTNPRD